MISDFTHQNSRFWWQHRFMHMGDQKLAHFDSAEAAEERLRRLKLDGFEFCVGYVDTETVFFRTGGDASLEWHVREQWRRSVVFADWLKKMSIYGKFGGPR